MMIMQRMKPCYNQTCRNNNDGICSGRRRSCAWRVKTPRAYESYIDMARHPDVVPKERDRNGEGWGR